MEINKSLYGDGSRDCRLRCETVVCDRCNECSLYAEGKCKSVSAIFAHPCGFGTVIREDGGTKQAKKFAVMKATVRADPLYHKLEHPSCCYVYRVGDTLAFDMPYISVEAEEGRYIIDSPFSKPFIMPVKDVTAGFLKRLCENNPRSLMGGKIMEYKDKVMPLMLSQLKKVAPEVYEGFIASYPGFDITPDYRGKFAYLKTLNHDPSVTYRDANGFCYHFEGEYLVGKSSSCLMPFNGKNVELKIPVDDGMTYKIDDNRQVLEDTRFR